MDVRVGLWGKLSAEELILLNCGVGEDSWEFLGLQGDQTSQSKNKSTLNIYWKEWCWSWSCTPLATWCKEPTHWKRPWCRERLKAGEEGGDRGRDDWMASLTQWIWIWARSRRWWRAGKPGVLQSMGSQQVGHGLATELQQQQRGRKDDVFSLVAEDDVQAVFFSLWIDFPFHFSEVQLYSSDHL